MISNKITLHKRQTDTYINNYRIGLKQWATILMMNYIHMLMCHLETIFQFTSGLHESNILSRSSGLFFIDWKLIECTQRGRTVLFPLFALVVLVLFVYLWWCMCYWSMCSKSFLFVLRSASFYMFQLCCRNMW